MMLLCTQPHRKEAKDGHHSTRTGAGQGRPGQDSGSQGRRGSLSGIGILLEQKGDITDYCARTSLSICTTIPSFPLLPRRFSTPFAPEAPRPSPAGSTTPIIRVHRRFQTSLALRAKLGPCHPRAIFPVRVSFTPTVATATGNRVNYLLKLTDCIRRSAVTLKSRGL